MTKYKRILLKLSGESLAGDQNYGIDSTKLNEYARQISEILKLNIQIGIVIGGGNIFRGLSGTVNGFDRVKGDQMGMLATVINSLALNSALLSMGTPSKVFTSIRMEPVGDLYSRDKAVESLEKGEIAILAGGTGNPFFTTDTGASLRAIEIGADILLKGTRVDGVYSDDPEKNPNATKYNEISFEEVYNKKLKVMDLTAGTMCSDNNMPVIVFNMDIPGNLKKIISGEQIGTLVHL
ncbi:MAG: UMP kinase [Prolixibacteraceae bacterium]|nr:UMP kinase [Prolixibacteraceae bacterium]